MVWENGFKKQLVRNSEEGGWGYWRQRKYTDGISVKYAPEWVQVKGGKKQQEVQTKKKPFVPPTFAAMVAEADDRKKDAE